jgi:hypothetical protein
MKITEIYESNTSHSQPQKPPVNESLVSLSEHIKRQVPLCDSIFRYQSEAYFDTFNKARQLREAGSLPQLDWESEEMLGTDIGKSIELEGVGTVWLDVPYLDEHVKGGLDSYYQLTKAKSLAKADGHDYDKLPEYHRGADQPHKEKYMALAKEVNEVSDFKKRELEYELRHEEPKRDPKKRVPYRTPQERIQDAKKRYSKAVGVMKGKTDEVKEAKGLGKRVKVVKGHFAGEEGTIREIKHGAFKGAPKSYYIDLDNGEMADNLPADILRLIKRTDVDEAEYQGKKVELSKPKRGGSKKFYVYVTDPKTKNVKKVSFGADSGGGKLAVKLKDPKARKAFADRHNCDQKNDKTKAGYWSCRLPRYAKSLGLSGGGTWW